MDNFKTSFFFITSVLYFCLKSTFVLHFSYSISKTASNLTPFRVSLLVPRSAFQLKPLFTPQYYVFIQFPLCFSLLSLIIPSSLREGPPFVIPGSTLQKRFFRQLFLVSRLLSCRLVGPSNVEDTCSSKIIRINQLPTRLFAQVKQKMAGLKRLPCSKPCLSS